MNYCVEGKHNEQCLLAIKELKERLAKLDFVESKNSIDYCFSLGGDGTLLKTINKYFYKDPLFVGINLGNLGFLCSFSMSNVDNIFLKDKVDIKEYRLIEASVNNESIFALNEVRIESLFGKCLDLKVYINGKLFSTLKCDGLCISSSIGSSGLNKTLGGSLVDTSLETIQIVEKLPVNNRKYKSLNNSLVLPKDTLIEVEIPSSYQFLLCYDSNFKKMRVNDKIKIKLSERKVRILVNKETTHLDRIKEAFL